MNNSKKLAAIDEWQTNGQVHPLTCTCGDHVVMKPGMYNGKVVLECPECEHIQVGVPECIYEAYNAKRSEENRPSPKPD